MTNHNNLIFEIKVEDLIKLRLNLSPGLMHETRHSGPVHWDDPEGWDGERGGRGLQDGGHAHPWLIHVNVWQKQL